MRRRRGWMNTAPRNTVSISISVATSLLSIATLTPSFNRPLTAALSRKEGSKMNTIPIPDIKILIQVPSWLPVFSGFIETVWSPDDKIAEQLRESGLEKFEWRKNWDKAGYQNAVAAECCAVLEFWLPLESGIASLDFEGVQSPREYDFANDAIN